MSDDRTLPELTRDAAAHFGDMMRNEIRLARAETVERIQTLGGGLQRIVIGAMLAGAALTVAMLAIAYALADMLPMWGAALLVAAIGAAVAWALVSSGRKALTQNSLTLPRTASQIATDVSLLKEKVTP